MEDGHTMLLNTLLPTESLTNLAIHTSLETKVARSKEEASRSMDTTVIVNVLALPHKSKILPSQSLLMLLTGVHTEVEHSATAEAASTMPSFWSVLSEETGRSRTLGEQAGVRVDTSDLQVPEALAESVFTQVFTQNDLTH